VPSQLQSKRLMLLAHRRMAMLAAPASDAGDRPTQAIRGRLPLDHPVPTPGFRELLSTLVDFPSCRRRSGHGIASVEFNTEEFADGDDLAAATAFSSGTYLAAHQVAGATSPLTEKAVLAT